MRKRVLVDVDGVLRDFVGSVIDTVKLHKGLDAKDRSEWKWRIEDNYENLPDDFDIGKFVFDNGNVTYNIMSTASPYSGNLDALQQMGDEFLIAIVSSQPNPICQKATVQWLDQYNVEYNSLHFTKDKTIVWGEYLIDDNLDNLRNFEESSEHRTSIAIDRPWNQEWLGYRAADISEAHKILLTFTK